jgi:hypothetical protein
MATEPVIVEARIQLPPADIWAALRSGNLETLQAHVFARTEPGGAEQEVFAYYSDELSFSASEFVGKTFEQARQLFTQRDIAYLRS